MGQEIKIKKRTLVGFVVLGLALLAIIGIFYFNGQSKNVSSVESIYNSLSPQAKALYYKQSEGLTKEVPERLVELDELTIGCFGTNTIMQMSQSETNLGGQCCGVLKDVEAYEVQLVALEKFIEENGNIGLIPKDPYDVSVEHAQKLIDLDKTITLSVQQQLIYDKAIDLSHHGGPCCCKCWKWYLMSGLAKELIVSHGWNENQIAELWDTSSSCGHSHDTNMHEHYNVAEGETHDHEANGHGTHHGAHNHEAMKTLDIDSSIITFPANIKTGEKTKITFELKEGNQPINNLVPHHARKLHVVIISKDMNIFGHIHPEDFNYDNLNGKYSVDFTFPKGGEYLVAIDGMANEGKFSDQFVIEVSGTPNQGNMYANYGINGRTNGNIEEGNDIYTKPVIFTEVHNGEYEVVMDSPNQIKKGEETTFTFTVMRNGEPLTDLATYLDAPIHFAIVSDDFSDFMHEHGGLPGGFHDDLPKNFGPTLELKASFENLGNYQLIGQIKHGNRLIVVPFTLDIEE